MVTTRRKTPVKRSPSPAATKSRSKSRSTRKTPTRAAATSRARTRSPVARRSRTPAKVESSSDEEEEEEDEKAPTTPKPATPVKEASPVKQQTPAKSPVNPVAEEEDELSARNSATKTVSRLIYAELFIVGVAFLANPKETLEFTLNDKELAAGSLGVVAARWVGLLVIQLFFCIVAATRGNRHDRKLDLQYFMFFPFMCATLAMHTEGLWKQDVLYGFLAVNFLNAIAMIWACYGAGP